MAQETITEYGNPNDTRELLIETFDFIPTATYLSEDRNSDSFGRFIVEGKCQHEGIKNANQREYPKGMFSRISESPSWQERLRNRSVFCLTDHPENGKTELTKVSHIMTGMTVNPDGVVEGRFEILDTPSGKVVKTLFESGCRVAVSSRGKGTVDKRTGTVQEDFSLDAFDFVATPSTPGAYPKPVGNVSMRRVSEEKLDPSLVTPTIIEAKQFLVQNPVNINVDNARRLELLAGLLEHELKLSNLTMDNNSDVGKLVTETVQQLKVNRNAIETLLEENMNTYPNGGSQNMTMVQMPQNGQTVQEALLAQENAQLKGVNESLQAENDQLMQHYDAATRMLAELKDRYKALETVAESATSEADASKSLLENLIKKVESLQEGTVTESELKEKYETREQAAKSLIESAVRRIKEGDVWIEELAARCVAGEKLAEAFVRRFQNSMMEAAIDNALVNESEEVAEKLRPILAESANVQEVNDRYALFQSLVESKSTTSAKDEKVYENKTEPLPVPKRNAPMNVGRQESLTESAKTTGSPYATPASNMGVRLARQIDQRMKRF